MSKHYKPKEFAELLNDSIDTKKHFINTGGRATISKRAKGATTREIFRDIKELHPELADKKAMTKSLYDNREEMRKRLNAGFEEAKKLGLNTSNSVGMGYCFGGSSILEFARSGAELKAFIPFHGNLATPNGQDYKNIPAIILF